MNDKSIHEHVEQLVAEEHRLYELSDERALSQEERKRLDEVNVQARSLLRSPAPAASEA